MFRARKKHGHGAARPGRLTGEESPAPDLEEHWRVTLPTDDLDRLMWGRGGVPPPRVAPAPDPKYQQDWAAPGEGKWGDVGFSDVSGDSAEEAVHDAGEEYENNDNILAALDVASPHTTLPPPPDDPPPPLPEKILLEEIAWKQRSGFGKYSAGLLQHEWEQRRVVLLESGILRYFMLPKNMEGIEYDPERATKPNKSPWVYDPQQTPRGEMDLRNKQDEEVDRCDSAESSSSLDKGIRRLTSLGKGDTSMTNVGGAKVQAQQRQSNPGPTPFEIDVTQRDDNTRWRFCFQSQSAQIEWLTALNGMAESGEEDSEDEAKGDSEGLANHGFQAGDHIIRWEMLPVLYPIQIHGIVLEAGKSCVIIADFGLASYDNRRASGDLTTWSDEGKDDSHDVIMAAWEKIKPKEKKRLNVNVVTDRKEIRRWTKINYGDQVEKDATAKKKGFFKSLLPWEPKNAKKIVEAKTEETDDETERKNSDDGCARSVDAKADDVNSAAEESSQYGANDAPPVAAEEVIVVEGEPEWAQPGNRPRRRTGSSLAMQFTDEGPSVFSIDHSDNHSKNELPKSDSVKLVLARTHFILENEDLLPSYHVFYSNSECIAVWCKTGRWSTLQAAVYLVSSSLGFGKSATMITISVAAAHAILLPALAVGGLAVVGAPLLYLRKSQDKWDKTTMSLTNEFWSRADPDVFVEAIDYWASRGKS